MIQIILIFLVAMIGYLGYFWPIANVQRPIVMGMLTGLVLGDIQTGIIVGASLELVFLGSMAIGASNPPDMNSAAILGTSYVITTGAAVAQGVAIGVPVSMLMQMVWNFIMAVLVPMLGAKADKYAGEGNTKAVDRIHYTSGLLQTVPLAVLTTIGYYVGSEVMEGLIDIIPTFITSGLNYAMGIIPAIGFAMLARMIMDKKTACFLFLGFILVAYFNINIIGVTAIACILVSILLFNGGQAQDVKGEVTDDNEF